MPPKPTARAEDGPRFIKANSKKSKAVSLADEDFAPEKTPKAGTVQQVPSPSTDSDTAIAASARPQRQAKPKTLKEDDSSDEEFAAPTPTKRPAESIPIEGASPTKRARATPSMPAASPILPPLHIDSVPPVSSTPGDDDPFYQDLKAFYQGLKARIHKSVEKEVYAVQENQGDVSPRLDTYRQRLDLANKENETLKEKLATSENNREYNRLKAIGLERKLEAANDKLSNFSAKQARDAYNEEREREIERLHKRISMLENSFSIACDEARELREMMNKDPEYFNKKVFDNEIEMKWIQLGNRIAGISCGVLGGEPEGKKVPADATHPEEVALLLKSWRKDPYNGMFHVMAFIWDQIHKDIFQGGGYIWGGTVGTKFIEFTQTLHQNEYGVEEAEALSFVKGRASDLLDTVFRKYKDNWDGDLDIMVDELGKDLAIFIDPTRVEDFNPCMKEILEKALDLQRIFIKSRAFFAFKPVSKDIELDEKLMDNRNWSPDHMEGIKFKVDLAISPMLLKIGGADGHGFDRGGVYSRAWVMVSPVAN
ncbi:Fc.00g061800.m01.CDS01 [Cosmosporella sp. VM-42]